MPIKEAILLIEDDSDDQEVLRDVFAELSVDNPLVFFDDCERAYQYLLQMQAKPFLILCDINLPKMNGIELKQKIDASEQLRRKAIPFVFLTTSDARRTIDEAYRITTLQGYFQKGHTYAEIKAVVKCILEYWKTALHPSPIG